MVLLNEHLATMWATRYVYSMFEKRHRKKQWRKWKYNNETEDNETNCCVERNGCSAVSNIEIYPIYYGNENASLSINDADRYVIIRKSGLNYILNILPVFIRCWEIQSRFPALPDFLRSSGSGTGSTQPREDN
jgi:hypothetical protein